MNNQELFNKVAEHLFNQGVQALDKSGCAYRGENNTKCAIGCLIPDEIYDEGFEGESIYSLLDNKLIAQLFENNSLYLLLNLQHVHDLLDNWKSTERMRNALRGTAIMRGLDYSIIYTLSFKNG